MGSLLPYVNLQLECPHFLSNAGLNHLLIRIKEAKEPTLPHLMVGNEYYAVC